MACQRGAAVQRVQLHHVARGARLPDRARGVADPRALRDPQAHRVQDRPVGARRRAALAPHQGRHADHGRRADPDVDVPDHAAVGRPVEPPGVGGAARHARLRQHRLDRRLPQGRAPQPARPAGALEVVLAGGGRPGGGGLPRLAHAVDVGAEPADRAVLQARRLSARHHRLRAAHLLRDRGHLERGGSLYWSRCGKGALVL